MTERRIVITGMGAVTPLGLSVDETWAAMREGRSGIRLVDTFDTSEVQARVAGQVRDFDPAPYFKKDPKAPRRCDRFEQLAMAAAAQAVEDAALDPEKEDLTRIGVMIGSAARTCA